jgi:hypothetical protein
MSQGKDAKNQVVLMIQGRPVPVTYGTVGTSSIKLDFDNPRVRLQMQRKFGNRKVTEEELIEVVRTQPGFPDLQRDIRENNGLHDPLIVRHNSVVAEGNSRATVLRILGNGKEDPRWQTVPVMRLPKDIPESMIATLLASYHVAGKTPWRKYAKAEHLSQLKATYGLSVVEIARATRMTVKKVEANLEAFEYFQKELAPGANGEGMERKFSHALELIEGKKLAAIRANPEHRGLMTRMIQENKLTGLGVRHAHKLFEDKKAVAALMKGRIEAAKREIEKKDPTLTSKFLKQMKSLDESLIGLPSSDLNTLKNNSAAADILIHLHSRLVGIAAVTGIKLGEIHGTARAKRA